MTARCYVIDVDGEPVTARFDREPNDEDLAAFRELIRAVRRGFDELVTPEIAERQAAARERNRERLRRLRGEQ